MAASFEEHPYHNPVIGWMNDLQALTSADVRAWYGKWYEPGNAVLVIAGDVNAKDVFALAQRYYGSIPAQALPERKHYAEPTQLGIKRLVVKAPAELPYIIMAYHAPVLRDTAHDWEPYALEVLQGVLDGNAAARLNKSLVRDQQVASSVGADYDSTARGPALFMLEGTPSQGKTVADVEAALRAQIEQLAKNGVSGEELARVKAQVMANEVYKLDSVFYQAMQIGQLESIGLSYKDIPLMLQKLQAVTAQQVQEVASKIFNDESLTVAVLEPQPLSGKPKHMMGEGGSHVR